MALITAQKRQALRLPTVDASVDSTDKFALLGIFEVQTSAPSLSTALKRQILRLPTVDGSVDSTDQFAFLGIFESGNAGAVLEQFETSWFINTTLTGSLLPLANDGNIAASINSMRAALAGSVPGAAGAPTSYIGKWASFFTNFTSYRRVNVIGHIKE